MYKFLLGIAVSFAITYLFMKIKVYIDIDYRRKLADDRLTVKIGVGPRQSLYVITVPVLELEQDHGAAWPAVELAAPQGEARTNVEREKLFLRNLVKIIFWHPDRWRKIKKAIKFYRRIYNRFVDRLLAKTSCEYFYWQTTLGHEDAAVTGLGVGLAWQLKTAVIWSMQQRLQFIVRPELNVKPVFDSNRLEVTLRCIFSIRLGNVINAAMSTVNLARKGAIGGG